MKERATVICKRDGQILYVRKPKSKWALPGGKIEAGETPQQAAARELRDETGLSNLGLIYLAEYEQSQVVHFVFMALIPASGRPLPKNEIAECKWLKIKDVDDLKTSEATRSIVKSFAV
jgi:8-oxo-dGTP diphosphatase